MPRVKRSVHARKKRRKVLEQAKGYWGLKSRTTATRRSRSSTRSSTPTATARTRSGRSASSGSSASTPPPARTGCRTTSSSPAAQGRDRARPQGARRPRRRRSGRVHGGRRAGEGRARVRQGRVSVVDHLGVEPDAEARPQAPRAEAQARGARALRGRGRGSRRGGAAAGIEPIELLVAGENVEPELLAAVSTLAHPARVVGVYRTRRPAARAARDDARALARRRSRQRRHAAARRRRVRRRGRALRGLRRPARLEGAARVGRRDLPRPAARLRRRARRRASRSSRTAAPPLHELELSGPVTFVLGAEREGLPRGGRRCERRRSRRSRRAGAAESLNVAVAGAIALYERSRRELAARDDEPAHAQLRDGRRDLVVAAEAPVGDRVAGPRSCDDASHAADREDAVAVARATKNAGRPLLAGDDAARRERITAGTDLRSRRRAQRVGRAVGEAADAIRRRSIVQRSYASSSARLTDSRSRSAASAGCSRSGPSRRARSARCPARPRSPLTRLDRACRRRRRRAGDDEAAGAVSGVTCIRAAGRSRACVPCSLGLTRTACRRSRTLEPRRLHLARAPPRAGKVHWRLDRARATTATRRRRRPRRLRRRRRPRSRRRIRPSRTRAERAPSRSPTARSPMLSDVGPEPRSPYGLIQ